MRLVLINETKIRMPRKFLQGWVRLLQSQLAQQMRAHAAPRNSELVIVWLEPKKAKALNRQFRKRNYATDVLSFQGLEAAHFGELALCPQVIQRQAMQHGFSFKAELGYMVLHGILHLLGYDHEKDQRQAKVMFELQDRVFAVAAKKMNLDW